MTTVTPATSTRPPRGLATTPIGAPTLDFGSLLIPAVDGMQVRAELDDREQVVGVAVMLEETMLQIQAFAAPKSESLWDEVRQEIAEGIRGGQGKAREVDGPFGRELQAEVVVTDESGATSRQPVRFIGIDGAAMVPARCRHRRRAQRTQPAREPSRRCSPVSPSSAASTRLRHVTSCR